MDDDFLAAYKKAKAAKTQSGTKAEPGAGTSPNLAQAQSPVASKTAPWDEPSAAPKQAQPVPEVPIEQVIDKPVESPASAPTAPETALPTVVLDEIVSKSEANEKPVESKVVVDDAPKSVETPVAKEPPDDEPKISAEKPAVVVTPAVENTVSDDKPVAKKSDEPKVAESKPAASEKTEKNSFLFKNARGSGKKDADSAAEAEKASLSPFANKMALVVSVVIILLVLAIAAAMLFKGQVASLFGRSDLARANSPAVLGNSQALADQYIAAVGRLTSLPSGQKPTVAAITDVAKLRLTQPFFNDAQNGDVVLIYPNRAILYDPKKNVIIDIAPVNLVSPNPQTSAVPVVSSTSATASAKP